MGLCLALRSSPDLLLTRVLTRRPVDSVGSMAEYGLTNSLEEFLSSCDLVVECSGDIVHGSEVVNAAQLRGLPVVTMATEFHVTVGSYFADRGILTEAEGDQPGALALLHEEVVQMGFKPLVYGNMKGFLNHDPKDAEMDFWAEKNGISRSQVVSFTDGTKMQFEQALVANGLGAGIYQRAMIGPQNMELEAAGSFLGAKAKEFGGPISDYVLNGKLAPGVFIVGEHPTERPEVLRYLKLGDGPYYTLLRPYHLCHLEVPRTIRRILRGEPILLNNGSRPTVHVVAVAKRDLPAGHVIDTAIGGMDLRGEAVTIAETPDAVALGLLKKAQLKHSISKGQVVAFADVDIPDSLAKTAWLSVREAAAASVPVLAV
ncbi:NAD(P)-dependent oxidoreductase [Phragmitibacter flavus]|uniref:NAD(P)-dependent oxidoreductase n=2 Tax=Phragmitibacter flavus TaxID=2576071 RepID=A0A5R8K994_9BACT|nr:NAD(P)-dependent oxidoreductase [Phragmitibacter flavus]